MLSVFDYRLSELIEAIIMKGGKKYNALQVWDWLYRKEIEDYGAMTNLPQNIIQVLKAEFSNTIPKIGKKLKSIDGTIKYLFILEDGLKVEAVLIPEEDRVTVCLSSQVGCKYNCSFCATGKLGFKRNLTSGEIVGQFKAMQKDYGRRITNVVYMGMGEPLDNYDQVIRSADTINDDRGYAVGVRKITISTFGLLSGIRRYIDDDVRYRLALSLHNPIEEERNRIMPSTRKNPLPELFALLREYTEKSKKKVVFEYVLLDGVNDTPRHANALKEMLNSLPAKLNLIPYHENELEYKCSVSKTQNEFYNSLQKQTFPVVFRTSRGKDIAAACGQLGLKDDFSDDL